MRGQDSPSSRHSRPRRRDAKSVTRQPALSFLQRVWDGLDGVALHHEEGYVQGLELGLHQLQPPQHEPKLPGSSHQVFWHLQEAAKFMTVAEEQKYTGTGTGSTMQVALGAAAMPKTEALGNHRREFTRLKATATGEPVFEATSAACRNAQLS